MQKVAALENYQLRHGTHDENFGKRNTVFMEWIGIKTGFWGENGGHILRSEFLNEAKLRGYSYLSSYVHRNVIEHRVNRGENIEIIQKYDPDKLDYYRANLNNQSYLKTPATRIRPLFSSHVITESTNSKGRDTTEMDKEYPIVD